MYDQPICFNIYMLRTTKTLTKVVTPCVSFFSCYIPTDLIKIVFKVFQRRFTYLLYIAKLQLCEKHSQRADKLCFLVQLKNFVCAYQGVTLC